MGCFAAFITGAVVGALLAVCGGVVAIWRSCVRDGEQAGENCE